MLWTFHVVPRKGEFGNETWLNDSWTYSGNSGIVVAHQRRRGARLRLPAVRRTPPATTTAARGRATTCSPRASSASTRRPASASGTSRRCITGSGTTTCRPRRCSPTSPSTAAASRRVAQVSKQAFVYVLDRVDRHSRCGRSKSGRCRRATCPASGIRRRSRSRRKPPAFDQQGVSDNDLIDFTPELKAEALKIVSEYKYGPLYTPPVLLGSPDGPKGTHPHARHQRRRRLGRRGVRQGDRHPLRAVGAPARRSSRSASRSIPSRRCRSSSRRCRGSSVRRACPIRSSRRTRGSSRSI